MLQTFTNKETENIFQGIRSHALRKIPDDLLMIAERRLDLLNSIGNIEEFKTIPSLMPEGAVRDAHGKWSIPIKENWRIAFRWDENGPFDVEIKS